MIFFDDNLITSLLTWDDTLRATEAALKGESLKKSALAPRIFAQILNTPKWMLTMPGYLDDDTYGGWACKILTGNPDNIKQGKFATYANIMFFDANSGEMKAVLDGVRITSWRTAAASAVATKYLHLSKPKKILAIFGCGDQGKAHAECFYTCFGFEEIRLWNRTAEKATKLAAELNKKFNKRTFIQITEKENCARGADIIITATSPGNIPLIKYDWLKTGVHINAIGVVGGSLGEKHYELDENTYKHAQVYVDNWPGANKELVELKSYGADIKAEVGEVILEKVATSSQDQITIFQSLGMASEDCAMARLLYDLYMEKQRKTSQ